MLTPSMDTDTPCEAKSSSNIFIRINTKCPLLLDAIRLQDVLDQILTNDRARTCAFVANNSMKLIKSKPGWFLEASHSRSHEVHVLQSNKMRCFSPHYLEFQLQGWVKTARGMKP